MIDRILDAAVKSGGQEISFMLYQRVLAKIGKEWVELKGEDLSIEEWEDLKDICLQGNEKVQLETKGFVSGMLEAQKTNWRFSFIEKKECFRAHLSLIKPLEQIKSQIENPLFWETVNKEKGIFLVAGGRRQGKTSLLQEIILSDQHNRLRLVGIHSNSGQNKNWPAIDSAVQLGVDALDADFNHVIYEGLERVIVDTNLIKSWSKWIEMAEQGQCVILTLSSDSVKSLINKVVSELDTSTLQRWVSVLNGIVVQKLVGTQAHPCSEILILKENQRSNFYNAITQKSLLNLNLQDELKDAYLSLNQNLVQKLIRRKIDIQMAFEASDSPEELDLLLKKMGL